MRIQPHENLTVWSLRHDQFWHDRYSPVSNVREQVVRAQDHVHKHLHILMEPKPIREHDRREVVHESGSARPADCHKCDHGEAAESGEYTPYLPDVWQTEAPQSESPLMVTVYFDKTSVSQGFTHGQSVPSAGSFLDIFA